MVKMLGTALVAGILVLSLVELACVSAKSPRASIGPEDGAMARVPPDLPLGSEADTTFSASPVLTR